MKRLSDRLQRIRIAQELLDDDGGQDLRDTSPGHALDYFDHLRAVVRKAARNGIQYLAVVLYGRVSSGKQGRNGNLVHQLDYVRRVIKRLGRKYGVTIDIIGEFGEVDVSAWKLTKRERADLVEAAKLARDNDAILVALNGSKFVRNKRYWRNGVQPTVDDFQQLMGLVGKVRLATIISPDKHEDRSADIKRGHQANDAKPGRPKMTQPGDKKRRRMRFKLPIIQLCKQDCGNREIGRQLELPEKTVRDWRKRYAKYWDASFSESRPG